MTCPRQHPHQKLTNPHILAMLFLVQMIQDFLSLPSPSPSLTPPMVPADPDSAQPAHGNHAVMLWSISWLTAPAGKDRHGFFSRAVAFCSWNAAQCAWELREGQKLRKAFSCKCLQLQITPFPWNFPVGKGNNLFESPREMMARCR